jgi:lipopolysaccharide transport system permease protein
VEASQALAAALTVPARKVRRIQASRGLVPVDFGELWAYRALLYLFMWRDIKTRYRQTFLSGFWAIFRPLFSMVLFSLIFGGIAHIKAGNGVPYPLFATPAVLAFTYFTSAAGSGVSAVASNGPLITKAYFPRLYAPFAVVTAPLVDLVLAFVVLLGLFPYYHRAPSWHILFLPLFILVAVLLALAISLWLSGLSVKYRDLTFGFPFVLQMWMYLTPVIYPVSFVPARLRWLISLNPMTGIVDGFRWSMIGNGFPNSGMLAASIGITLGLLVPGLYHFRRTERTFADLV